MLVMLEEKYLLGTLETKELNQAFQPIIENLETRVDYRVSYHDTLYYL
jgi:hypothetical protein